MSQRRHEAPELASAARRMMRALAVRATEGDTEAIEELAHLRDDLDDALGAAIAGARAAKGYSWAAVAELVQTTRQNAQQRWGAAQAPETFPCEFGCGWLFGSELTRTTHHVKEHGAPRCPKTVTPKPQRCLLTEHHAGLRHVMGTDDQADPEPLEEIA